MTTMNKIIPALIASMILATAGAAYASAPTKSYEAHKSAAGTWLALQDVNGGCFAANRAPGPDEHSIGGRFATESQALAAVANFQGCSGDFGSHAVAPVS